jgi:sigma-E factor negative regulatory protein RseB
MSDKLLRFPVLLLALCGAQLCLAETSAQVISHNQVKEHLNRMIEATRTLDYEGTFVYIQGQKIEVMTIAHSGLSGRQRLFSLNGMAREVLVENDQVTCLLPQQQVAFSVVNSKRSPFPISLPAELDQLEKQYQFRQLTNDRVAGRKVDIVAIEPRDQFRFGYQLWLDDETGLVLRSALVDSKGQFLEQLIFTEINFPSHIEISTHPLKADLIPAGNFPPLQGKVSEAVKDSAWRIADLPPGFKQVLHNLYPEAPHPTEHIIFSDGLANISIFLESLSDKRSALLDGPLPMDAMNAYGVVVDDHQVIVVGEVPLLTVERIAHSIEYSSNTTTIQSANR